jgi:hypothetical protein
MNTTDKLSNRKTTAGELMAPDGNRALSSTDEELVSESNRNAPDVITTFVHFLVSCCVFSPPGLVAVCSWDGNLTYGELGGFSSTLAAYLETQGVRSEALRLSASKSPNGSLSPR